MEDINYALVEEVRPPIYTAMKYWGKKPHNIWREYIKHYTPEGGLVLDPFTGSAISAFEAVKVNRKSIAFDLNPLSSFIIEVISSNFNEKDFKQEVNKIISEIEKDEQYNYFFTTSSRRSESRSIVQHFKWDNVNGKKTIYEMGIKTNQQDMTKENRYISQPIEEDFTKADSMNDFNIPYYYPNEQFIDSPSFNANFIRCIGGNNFSNLWTRRNLYILSYIFDLILKVDNEIIKKQLLFAFIQTIHLCTKMSVPRRSEAKRDFSTSWGRSAYLCSSRQMELNPLLTFKHSCLGKQSVESCLKSASNYFNKTIKIEEVNISHKNKNKLSGFDIKYGAIDINSLDQYIPEKSIDFIITDPPYGGLVQYLDLSYLWLSWLKHYDKKYAPNFEAEITIKRGKIDLNLYKMRFTNGLKQLNTVLKDNGKIVFTFHNKRIDVWNTFLNSLKEAGFKIEKVVHQQNRRSGESVVANPYGTSGTDFYIRCIKDISKTVKTNRDEFKNFVVHTATRLIAQRNEPTPYQILFNGILAELSMQGFDIGDFDQNLETVLKQYVGKIFKIQKNTLTNSGNLWWFINPRDYIKYPDILLSERVDRSVLAFLRRKISVTYDEVLGEIFMKFPNGLTPDIKSIESYLKKYSTKSGGKWIYNSTQIESDISKHTEVLKELSILGKELGYVIYIGKREQPEKVGNELLRSFADFSDLSFLEIENNKKERIEMVDMLWLQGSEICLAIEVENSTNFISAIQRASNLSREISKIMVIPDIREKELKNINDSLFLESFKDYNWKYLIYSDINKVIKSKTKEYLTFLKNL
ncbi:MAG: DNA methyltransferase [Deltaproteobacteria bacterium]|nr:DNA methyltransferase [Deltaproteobacteria bacterium]